MKMTRKLIGAGIASALALASAGAKAAGAWEGLYIGAGLGSAQGEAEDWVFQSGLPTSPRDQDLDAAAMLSMHLGYQKQFGNFVVGAEVSGNWSNGLDGFGEATCPSTSYWCVAEVDQVYIVGPRLGYAVSNNWMVYLNGGYAQAHAKTAGYLKAAPSTAVEPTSEWHDGWALGGGFEYALSKNFTVGAEYTHVDLDSSVHVWPDDSRTIEPSLDIVRARLSYAFR